MNTLPEITPLIASNTCITSKDFARHVKLWLELFVVEKSSILNQTLAECWKKLTLSTFLLRLNSHFIDPSCRMKRIRFTLLLLCTCSLLQAQNISGIINSYAQVTAIAGTTITTISSTGFAVGDKIIVIQMKGASITTSNTSAYGDITNLNNAGNWEFATIASITGNDIVIASPLVKTYTMTAKVRLVSLKKSS